MTLKFEATPDRPMAIQIDSWGGERRTVTANFTGCGNCANTVELQFGKDKIIVSLDEIDRAVAALNKAKNELLYLIEETRRAN